MNDFLEFRLLLLIFILILIGCEQDDSESNISAGGGEESNMPAGAGEDFDEVLYLDEEFEGCGYEVHEDYLDNNIIKPPSSEEGGSAIAGSEGG